MRRCDGGFDSQSEECIFYFSLTDVELLQLQENCFYLLFFLNTKAKITSWIIVSFKIRFKHIYCT